MRVFSCSVCKQPVYFENVRCTECGHSLGFLPDLWLLSSLEPAPQGRQNLYVALAPEAKGRRYRLCKNSVEYGVCNWLVPEADAHEFCESCRLNVTVPKLEAPGAMTAWARLETAKRRLLFTLKELQLPIESREEVPDRGLGFSFMGDEKDKKVFTGHSDGHIVINIAEADDPFREKIRVSLGEGYRTVLGHFRHEIGHYYWDRLVRPSSFLPACRALFGDERVSYADAVKRHYAQGAPVDWPNRFVSSYATMHPWEDWAETWAHYLHMVDTLETARSYDLVLRHRARGSAARYGLATQRVDFRHFDDLIGAWVPLTLALNSLNRSMGLLDAYPFVLTKTVARKLRFIDDLIENWNADESTRASVIGYWETMLAKELTAIPPDSVAVAQEPSQPGEPTPNDPPPGPGMPPEEVPPPFSPMEPPNPQETPPPKPMPDPMPPEPMPNPEPDPAPIPGPDPMPGNVPVIAGARA